MTLIPCNIAAGCPCLQSSVNPREQADPDGARAAVDGNKTGHAAFTTQSEQAPWWQIDLGQPVALDSVVVYNWDVAGLPYSAAGRSRARFLQVWGSLDGQDWQLLHDRRAAQARVDDFGGIHTGPLCIPLAPARYRHLRLALAGAGILQLDEVQVYALREREPDAAIRDMLDCAAELSFAMARRILAALDLPVADLPGHIQRLGIGLNRFSTVFVANLLVEHHCGDAARALLDAACDAGANTGAGAPAADAPFLSFELPAHPLPREDLLLRDPPVVPPAALPLLQSLATDGAPGPLAIAVDGREFAYLLQGDEAHLLCQDCRIGGQPVLDALRAALFARHPALERIVAADVLDAPAAAGEQTAAGHADILDLPSTLDEYKLAYISPRLLAGIEAKERDLPPLRLATVAAADLDAAAYREAARSIVAGMPGLAGADWDALRPYARVSRLESEDGVLAGALWLAFGAHCHLLACHGEEASAAPDDGDLSKVLQFRLIADLLQAGFRHVHLPRSACAGNILFGALGQPRRTLLFRRDGAPAMPERIAVALAGGVPAAQVEAELGQSLEALLGGRYEDALHVDFDAIVENDVLGTDANARRYQPTIRDAFFMMMKHVPFRADEVFVDVGSGKGKMLYYAYQLGYRDCIGMEISPMLLEQAKVNFERLRLPARIRLWQRDARVLDLDELGELGLFYLANPFGSDIMDGFLRRLVESQAVRPRTLRIVYCVAMVEAPFAAHGFTPVKVFEQGVDGWRFPRSVIYERQPK